MALGEVGGHLLDLHDLLRRAAEEAEERFSEGLAQDAEAGIGGEASGEVGVATPRQGVVEQGPVHRFAQVVAQVGGHRAGRSSPFRAARRADAIARRDLASGRSRLRGMRAPRLHHRSAVPGESSVRRRESRRGCRPKDSSRSTGSSQVQVPPPSWFTYVTLAFPRDSSRRGGEDVPVVGDEIQLPRHRVQLGIGPVGARSGRC